MINYPQITGQLFNVPLAAERAAVMAFAASIAPRLFDGPVTFAAPSMPERRAGVIGEPLRDMTDWEGNPIYTGPRMIAGTGVAVIEIEGALVPKGKWTGALCDATSYEGIHVQVRDCRASKDIRGVILEVDSFGGSVAGAFACAEAIHQLALEKPVIAILTDNACSAGYLMASAAREIVMPWTGIAGSIGVIMLHADFSKLLAKEGIVITPIFSGANKNDFSPYEPLPKEVFDRAKAENDFVRDRFAETVARYRGARFDKGAALATEASSPMGEDAKAAGLVDAIAYFDEAAEAFVAEIGRKAG